MDLLKALIVVSEKAANIARLCRQNKHLFQLLIQKKETNEANPRFVEDFKTLADVLIQELVRHDIGNQFPDLCESIKGEENNTFSNKLGETIKVEIKDKQHETAELLYIVLNGDREAADLLALELYKTVNLPEINTQPPTQDFQLDLDQLGIWIDPIDSTAEYIHGNEEVAPSGISISGLKCVTVLIGAYNKTSGLPIIGIVNQPFNTKENNTWHGVCFWGVSSPSLSLTSFTSPRKSSTRIICISSSENAEIIRKLESKSGFEIVETAGAGHKILTVIIGLADGYVLSKSSTFKWDTCGPQAILKALGGDIVVFDEIVKNRKESVKYDDESSNCNKGGIIAYRDEAILDEIIKCLR